MNDRTSQSLIITHDYSLNDVTPTLKKSLFGTQNSYVTHDVDKI